MRPVRAGTNVDKALVEIELTVGNAGTIAAEDVRISTFMLAAGSESEMERLLIEPRDDAAVSPMTIAAGEGARVDATLAMNRAALGQGDFRPSSSPTPATACGSGTHVRFLHRRRRQRRRVARADRARPHDDPRGRRGADAGTARARLIRSNVANMARPGRRGQAFARLFAGTPPR
ncbi:hypothetical protein AB5I41_29790 [Sphingomonas sp. MMS24-JH45]